VRLRGALAGALGAAVALAAIELVTLLDATGTSVTEAVGNRFIESFAASLKDLAIALFGTNDKVALQLGTVVVALGLGAWIASWAHRWPNLVVAGFGGFALLGLWAAWNDPLASRWVSLLAVVLAVGLGVLVTFGLQRRWTVPGVGSGAAPLGVGVDGVDAVGEVEGVGGEVAGTGAGTVAGGARTLGRRAVLVNAGVLSAGLLVLVGAARAARATARDAVVRVDRALPEPVRRLRVPTQEPRVEGLSRYVTPTSDFFRIDTAQRVPAIDPDSHAVKVTGLVDRELVIPFTDLLERDLVEVPITLSCVSNEVGGRLVGNARWLGVPLAELLGEAGVQPEAEQLMTESVDGFTAGFPIELALDGRDALVAIGMNGEPLPREHGYPVRLVVPGVYGYVSATKWLSELRVTTWDEEGFWIPRGWARLGPVKTQSRIDVPRRGSPLVAGAQVIAGVAWAPTKGIRQVEVQVDDGRWRVAQLGDAASDDTWVQWWLDWAAVPGEHVLRVRATDGTGEVQTEERTPVAPDGASGHHTVTVQVDRA
jgi:DMSO/TMAO reductase YedYZ molybdopterin-dependent catalytic subunit